MSSEPRLRKMAVALCIPLMTAACSETFGPAGDETGSLAREAAPPHVASYNAPDEGDYKIAPFDVLEISVYQVKDLDGIRQVSRTGFISMPLIGELQAKGRSIKELERDIAARLGSSYLRAPDVHVSVKEFTSQRFTVEGAVTGPGTFAISGRTTLLQAIAQARGLTKIADRDVAIFRNIDNRRFVNRYDLSAIRSGEREDPVIMAGDIVVVGESAIRSAWTEFKDVFSVGLQGGGFAARFLVP